jgi:hypothetical protein
MSEVLRTAARRGYSVAYRGKTLLSRIDPAAQAEKIAAGAGGNSRTLYFCPSPVLGYGLAALLSMAGEDSAVLGIETDEKLLSFSRESIEKEILGDPRFALTGIKDPAELCSFVRERWGERRFRRVVMLKLSGGWQLDGARYERLAGALRGDMAVEWGNAMTLVKLGRCFIRNVLRNLVLLQNTQADANFSFGDAPVLVLGAGPSLDDFLDALEKSAVYQPPRSFKIICVDTCIPALLERGIFPDLAVILESQHWNLRDFIGARNSGIAAAVDLSAYPDTAAVLGGKVIPFFTPWTNIRLFERLKERDLLPEILPPLGSVGLSAVELARRCGAGPIICSGIDFSFTLDRAHARSTPGHLASLAGQNRLNSLIHPGAAFRKGAFTIMSKSGIPVRSNPAMRNYRSLFEQEFAADPRIRDIAGTGLPLGLKTLSMEKALELLAAGTAGNPAPDMAEGAAPGKAAGACETGGKAPAVAGRLGEFIRGELGLLEELRDMLTGLKAPDRFETLLDQADYLWAHFPDSADFRRTPPGQNSGKAANLGFLKRVRAEIDPFIKLWESTLGELER